MNNNLNNIIDYNDYNKYFMTNLIGKKYIVYLNPHMRDINQIIESIKTQLPSSYNIEDLKIICEGRNLKSFDSADFPDGICAYFNKLNTIYVIGGDLYDIGSNLVENEKVTVEFLKGDGGDRGGDPGDDVPEAAVVSGKFYPLKYYEELYTNEHVYYMTNLIGKKYPVYLNPSITDKTQIIESIKTQLPESYNNENFKIILQGKYLESYDFKDGVGSVFKNMEKIYIVGGL